MSWRRAGLALVFIWFFFGGLAHFVWLDTYTAIVPPYVPFPRQVALFTGVCDIAGAFGVLWPRTRQLARYALMLYCVCVTPVHIEMLLHADRYASVGLPVLWGALAVSASADLDHLAQCEDGMTTLEESLALYPVGEGAWRAQGDPNYEAGTGMFGGWTAALLVKAVLADERAIGEPSTLNVNYVSRVDPTSALSLTATPIGGSRSVTTWQVELRNESTESLAALATIVMAARRENVGFSEFAMPDAPAPDAVPTFHPPAPFGQQTDVRPISGYPPFNLPTTRSLHWAREMTGGALDHARIAYLADCYPPRILFRGSAWRPSSTLTMSVYFYASAAELAAVGDGFTLSEVIGTRAESSTCGSQLRLWSAAGTLLATSEQMTWYK